MGTLKNLRESRSSVDECLIHLEAVKRDPLKTAKNHIQIQQNRCHLKVPHRDDLVRGQLGRGVEEAW